MNCSMEHIAHSEEAASLALSSSMHSHLPSATAKAIVHSKSVPISALHHVEIFDQLLKCATALSHACQHVERS